MLSSRGPVGDVPAELPTGGRLRLHAPPDYDLDRVARSHGGVGLAPTAYDGTRLHLRLPGPVSVAPDLTVTWSGPDPDEAVLRRVLALDDDLEPLWEACDRLPELAWVRPAAAGRLLRAPTVWQDLVGVLASTRTSYRGAQAMVRHLVDGGPFPTPAEVLERDLRPWGHRAASLQALARGVDDGLDPESWLDPALPDDEVAARVRRLRGFGPYATAQVLPLLGRPRPLQLDGWLAAQAGDVSRFAPLGRWAGSGLWLAVTRDWFG